MSALVLAAGLLEVRADARDLTLDQVTPEQEEDRQDEGDDAAVALGQRVEDGGQNRQTHDRPHHAVGPPLRAVVVAAQPLADLDVPLRVSAVEPIADLGPDSRHHSVLSSSSHQFSSVAS